MPLQAEVAVMTNPGIGVFIFVIGGLAGAVFYLPFQKVRNWDWESYWFVYAVFGLFIAPWIVAFGTLPNLVSVLRVAPGKELTYCFLCGMMWGVGNLTWGLMIRYLGVGLGLAIGCGLCSATGTLIPPVFKGEFLPLLKTNAGLLSLTGVLISLLGILLIGTAGMSKERELPEEIKKIAVAEYNFRLGIFVAIFSGLMSAALSFGLQGGSVIEKLATTLEPVTGTTWKGMPVLAVVLTGGFVVNGGWCLFLNMKKRTKNDYISSLEFLPRNISFAGLAGVIWCSQWVCFKSGETAMGNLSYVGFSVVMASTILFSTLLGIILGEWKGTSAHTRRLLTIGIVLLVISSIASGYSGYLKQ